MKRYIKYVVIAIVIIGIIGAFFIISKNNSNNVDDGKFKIVTSFYPIYIMAANITEGANNIELANMADVNTGCIHNYTISTEDMKKIEKADVFIENGLGLENFMEKVSSVNKNIKIINSSEDITNVIQNNDEVNPHIWTSISNYIMQVRNIEKSLEEANPENAEIYRNNTDEYVNKLNELKLKYASELQMLSGKTAICLNESFEYLGKDIGLILNVVHTDHEESVLSAETIKKLIDETRQSDTKIIIVDVNDNLTNAQTIANETGAQIYKLDSAITGSLNKEAYIDVMAGNIEILKNGE